MDTGFAILFASRREDINEAARDLKSALVNKEHIQKLLTDLASQKGSGTINDQRYEILKDGYQKQMEASVARVASVKKRIALQLQTVSNDQNEARAELENIRSAYNLSNITLERKLNQEEAVNRRISKYQVEIVSLQQLLDAKSSTSILEDAPTVFPDKFSGPVLNTPQSGIKKNIPLIIAVSIIIILLATIFSVQITIPIATIENYTDTETKQEPYTEQETYVISSTAKVKTLYASNGFDQFIDQDRRTVGKVYRFNSDSYKEGTTPAQMIHASNCIEEKLDFSSFLYFQSVACTGPVISPTLKMIMNWKTVSMEDKVIAVVMLLDNNARVPDNIPENQILSLFPVNKIAPEGELEYSPTDGRPFLMAIRTPNQWMPGKIHFSLRYSLSWDEIVSGSRTVTKYRDVTQQVVKQKTVTTNKQVSLFEAMCANR